MTRAPLADAAALITGASSGIGEATALRLAGMGAAVALMARRGDRLAALTRKITDCGGRALPVAADITRPGEVEDAVADVVRAFGRLDVLVNNAGLMLLGPVEHGDPADWQQMIEVNLRGTLNCTHAALPHLLAAADSEPRHVADLVNVSSVAGRIARNGLGVYNATKFGVNAFSESLRQELASRHVRVSVIEPGAVATELTSHNPPQIRGELQARHSLIEVLQPDDIADAIGYIITRPRRVAVNEMFVRPSESER